MSTTSSTSAATTTTGSTTSIATVITDAGFAMLRAAPGHKLVYTRAVCGSGHVDKTQLATLTEISDYVMDLSIVEFGPSESSATLRLQLDNSKAPKEFQLHQIGVCAKLLDGEEELIGETLIQVMQYEEPDIVRAVPHVSEFIVNVLVGQAETVEGVIDMAAYVSIRQFSGRTVNGKPLSADVVLSGEDIKVSPDDETTIKAALSNKAEKNSAITWYDLPLQTGFQPVDTVKYGKDDTGWVQIAGAITHSEGPLQTDEVIAVLPEGYRPSQFIPIPLIQSGGNWAVFGWIDTVGRIKLTGVSPPPGFNQTYGISLGATFKAF